jgi:hypothetical protein
MRAQIEKPYSKYGPPTPTPVVPSVKAKRLVRTGKAIHLQRAVDSLGASLMPQFLFGHPSKLIVNASRATPRTDEAPGFRTSSGAYLTYNGCTHVSHFLRLTNIEGPEQDIPE